jgi:hypothetical protein
MPGFGRRIDGPGGRRRAHRQPVALAASALTLDGSRSVMIEDVAPTGAKLRAHQLPATGSQLLVRVGAIELFASVIWSRKGECGIVFDEALNPKTIEILKQEGNWATVLESA